MIGMRLVDIGGVIPHQAPVFCVATTRAAPALVADCAPMIKSHCTAGHIATWTLAELFPFGNNIAVGFG